MSIHEHDVYVEVLRGVTASLMTYRSFLNRQGANDRQIDHLFVTALINCCRFPGMECPRESEEADIAKDRAIKAMYMMFSIVESLQDETHFRTDEGSIITTMENGAKIDLSYKLEDLPEGEIR